MIIKTRRITPRIIEVLQLHDHNRRIEAMNMELMLNQIIDWGKVVQIQLFQTLVY